MHSCKEGNVRVDEPEVQRQRNQLPTPWLPLVHPTVCFHHHRTYHPPISALENH